MPKKFLILCLFNACFLNIIAQPAIKDQPPVMPDSTLNAKLAYLSRLHHLDSAALSKYDKIITFDKEVHVGNIYSITYSEVRFTCPPDGTPSAINKSKISQILYTNGSRDVFIALEDRTVKQQELVDTARIIIKNQRDWMKVMVTENPSDVVNLKVKGNIKANYEAVIGNMSNDEMMRHVGNILKKKAALLKAHRVLVDTKFFHKSYGDLPSVEVTARAFGYE